MAKLWEPVPSLVNFNELGQDAVAGAGMDKRDLPVMNTHARLAIDQLDIFGRQPVECRRQIADTIGDVMQSWPSRRQEARDPTVGICRRHNLKVTTTGMK